MNTQHKLASVLVAVALSIAITVPSVLAESVLEQISPNPKVYLWYEDFLTMEYSGTDDVTALVEPVDVTIPPEGDPGTSTSGCQTTDFAGFTPGKIALIQRGGCYFRVKALNAEYAGAVGVIIFNEGQEGFTGVIFGTLMEPGVTIPVVGTSYAVGEELCNLALSDGVVVHMVVEACDGILGFFDYQVTNDFLAGSGPKNSADGRRDALRKMIEVAGDLIDAGLFEEACLQLLDVSRRCDGEFPPPDFVEGDAASELNDTILEMMEALGCE